MPSDDYILGILATFRDAATGDLKKFGQAMIGTGKAIGKAGKEASSFTDKLAKLGAKFISIKSSAVQVVEAVKKFYEFGKAGAVVEQTEQSFDGLIDKLGVTPRLLGDLRDASSGTISDMQLMSATTTLLAGAQGDLATALAGSTPELLEIAKAANKLNPSLGSTAFLYESLATGIKRASPMILDNLGLTIKIGEANERYAESIGKAVDQLTAEEQKLALLAETRRAGKVLIEQAGGAAGSATDDFERLDAAVENAADAFKKQLAPAAREAATALTFLFDAQVAATEEFGNQWKAIAKSNLSYKEREKRLNALVKSYGYVLNSQGKLTRGQNEYNKATGEWSLLVTDEIIPGFENLTNAQKAQRTEEGQALEALVRSYYDVSDATDYQSEAQWALARSTGTITEEIQKYGPWAQQAARDTWELANAEEWAAIKARDLREEQERLNEQFGELAIQMRGAVSEEQEGYIESTERAQEKVDGLRQKVADLKAEPSFPTDEQQEQLAEYRDEIDEEVAAIDELAVAHREAMKSIAFDLIMTRIAQEDWGEAGLELATTIAESWGLVDDDTAAMMRGINTTLGEFDKDGDIARARREIQWLTGDFTAAGAAAEVAGSDMARQRIGEGFMREGVAPVSVFDDLRTEIEGLVEPDYELRFGIPNERDLEETLGTFRGITEYLSKGTHTINFRIKMSTPWPGAAEDIGGGPPGGGGGGPPPGSPWADPSRLQFGGVIRRSGLAFVEAGELVIPPMEAQQMQQGGGGTTIAETNNEFNLNVTSVQEMTSLIQEFEMMRAMVG